MAIKKLCQVGLFCLSLLSSFQATAQNNLVAGDSIQIYTEFQSVMGKPSWLLILRDMTTGEVLPYVYDIQNNYNFFIALAMSHHYRVTTSTMTFGPYAVIHNFCHLEDGIISWHSLYITLRGSLTPNRNTAHCNIQRYQNLPFPLIGGY
ncbi:MAG: hypothetical protein P4M14_09135 [Gammaproteobacteria bacterium]|nr:hypothetical protein [Gammaproteobacteria bacterium]